MSDYSLKVELKQNIRLKYEKTKHDSYKTFCFPIEGQQIL